ncbi:Serine protease, subtilisin family [Alkalithermobacter thermoalcaliphilus JW-YL-7 = DSM 7308]|uniref:Peptidase S8 and S53 subtilisin kexin sedolisin n=1 Tax=Alkalithermobacter thermoalcaliphilus JW-YL-7 = DSM 7308 TaxID=1121328 RepID=A0A150FNV6_CLOPD|nr:peptidase S8 and S53 subtilisin kexin sedolisin [[Clostridium] paradoxum JW-YL-7 = DSM 7308]SHK85019.1 Serine protease, subtilisin family [[Clostridium] paradoxum JW-YL-7 = DSM 7308]
MSFEVIVKYHSDLTRLEDELEVEVEILNEKFAILTLLDESIIDRLLEYEQIEYIERPFILGPSLTSFQASGIDLFKVRTDLSGEGVLIGIIDSGVDFRHPLFINQDGTSKIIRIWDQTREGNPPEGFKGGYEYTKEDIDNALKGEEIPFFDNIGHGTHVAGIASTIAPNAQIVVVKVGVRGLESFGRSTEFMRAIKYLIDVSTELNKPLVINISYGSNEGPKDGSTLFEQYIDDMSLRGRTLVVVASGNEGDKSKHRHLRLLNNMVRPVEFSVGSGEDEITVEIWKKFSDDFSISIINPSGVRTQKIDRNSGVVDINLGNTNVTAFFSSATPYSLNERAVVILRGDNFIQPGIWSIEFESQNIVEGDVNIYLPISERLSPDTKFLDPTVIRTITTPATSSRALSVGSYNHSINAISSFSGRGDRRLKVIKPDIVAPGENIVSSLPFGGFGALSGTSMAAPHVTGSAALLMQWGIVDGNDPFLYGQRLKAMLLREARRDIGFINYPDEAWGYGKLDLSRINTRTLNETYRKENTQEFIIMYEGDIISALNEKGIDKVQIIDRKYAIVYLDGLDVSILNTIPEVTYYKRPFRMVPLIDTSVDKVGGTFFHNHPYIPLTGRGILVAIIDSGIDYTHPDFIYEDGTSKIVSIWDQTLEGNPLDGFIFGKEFTNEQINEALFTNERLDHRDDTWHGTMLAGIIGGRGGLNSNYVGVAPDSEFIVVKLRDQGGYYKSSDLMLGIKYAYEVARRMRMPLVFNISLGTNEGSHDGMSILENYIYEISRDRGMIFVAAAGNEADKMTKLSGIFNNTGEIQDVEIIVGPNQRQLDVMIWARKPDKVSVSMVSPTGEFVEKIPAKLGEEEFVRFILEDTSALVRYRYPEELTGDTLIEIHFDDIKPGNWIVRLHGDNIVDGRYNVYLPNKSLLSEQTRLLRADPLGTIVTPATAESVITVGAYNHIDNSLYRASSRGPTRDDKIKPDLVAPGVNITSTIPGGYGTFTGTSVAAAHVAGAVALLLEWGILNNNDPTMYIQKVKTYLTRGTERRAGEEYPNVSWGYGTLNLRRAFEQIRGIEAWIYPIELRKGEDV